MSLFYIQAVDLIYLFLIVGVLLGVDFIFLVVVTSFDNTRLNRREKELGTDDDVSFTHH